MQPEVATVPAVQPGAATLPVVAEAATATASDVSAFGLPPARAQIENGVLKSRVATVDAAGVGRWAITLDNGQRWEQRESASGPRRPQAGDEARIEEASLGSFLLRVPGKGSFRVRRVK